MLLSIPLHASALLQPNSCFHVLKRCRFQGVVICSTPSSELGAVTLETLSALHVSSACSQSLQLEIQNRVQCETLRDKFSPVSAGLGTCLACPAQRSVHIFGSGPASPSPCGKLVSTSVAVRPLMEFASVSVQAFFQGDPDPAVPCAGSAAWVRLRHSCGYLEHGLPGRAGDNTGDNAAHAWEGTDTNGLGTVCPQHPPAPAVWGARLP